MFQNWEAAALFSNFELSHVLQCVPVVLILNAQKELKMKTHFLMPPNICDIGIIPTLPQKIQPTDRFYNSNNRKTAVEFKKINSTAARIPFI